jgi:hypothetical protein
LVVIFRPLPIKSPTGNIIAIAGNTRNKKSEPAFIKINKYCIGSSFVIQNLREIPLAICLEIPLPAELLCDTTWGEAQEQTALAAFPNMAPFLSGTVIPDGVTSGNEVIKAFLSISP